MLARKGFVASYFKKWKKTKDKKWQFTSSFGTGMTVYNVCFVLSEFWCSFSACHRKSVTTPDLDSEELSDIGSLHLNLAHLKLEVLEPLAQNRIRCILKYAKKFVASWNSQKILWDKKH